MIEASIEWQGTLLDVGHFQPGAELPAALQGYEGVSEALRRLGPGECTSVGPLSLSVRHVPGETSVPRKPVEWAPLGYVGATLTLTGVFLALMALLPPQGQAMTVPNQSLAGRLIPFAAQALEPELFETQPPATEGDVHGEEHGEEWGREGTAGSATAELQPRERRERTNEAPNLRAAASRSGVLSLGAVFEGVGASDSPFREALGQDIDAALGNLTGSVSGESFGFGGLAMTGTGRHAGGLGLDAIHQPDGMRGLAGARYGTCGCGVAAQHMTGISGLGEASGTLSQRLRTSAVPQIRSAGPEVRGALDPSLIRRVVRRHRNETRHCYEQALQARPDLAGRVAARFIIDPSGAVSVATLESSTLSNASVEACVLQVVRRMNFPATPHGNVSVVSYPWVFSTL